MKCCVDEKGCEMYIHLEPCMTQRIVEAHQTRFDAPKKSLARLYLAETVGLRNTSGSLLLLCVDPSY